MNKTKEDKEINIVTILKEKLTSPINLTENILLIYIVVIKG